MNVRSSNLDNFIFQVLALTTPMYSTCLVMYSMFLPFSPYSFCTCTNLRHLLHFTAPPVLLQRFCSISRGFTTLSNVSRCIYILSVVFQCLSILLLVSGLCRFFSKFLLPQMSQTYNTTIWWCPQTSCNLPQEPCNFALKKLHLH